MNRSYFAAALLVAIIAGAVFWYAEPRTSDLSAFPRLEDAKLTDRTIVDFGYNEDGTVSYSYLAEPVPEKLAENEVPELRTENSYTKFIEVVEEGEDPIVKLQSIFYPQPQFAKDVDGTWKRLEYATTTQQAFRDRDAGFFGRIAEVFVRTAYADAISPFSEAGDGYVEGQDNAINPNFATCLANAWGGYSGTSANYTNTTFITYVEVFSFFDDPVFDCTGVVQRGFLPFDTSTIPAGSTIDTAAFNVYVTAKTNSDNDGLDYLTVIQTSQATHTQLTVSDVNLVGSTEAIDSGQRKDITSISTSAYLTFTLNATGEGFVKTDGQSSSCSATAGITCLGLREGHDFNGTAPDNATSNSVTMSSSEHALTTQDPYLDVTYTVAAASLATKGVSITGGGLNITGGGLNMY